jgi:hypothetical protein
MKPSRIITSLAAFTVASSLSAQQPAPGRGGAPALNPAQTAALTQAVVPPALTAAAATAATQLAQASLALPRNDAAISAAAAKLGEAELALAQARAGELAKVQALLQPVSGAQAAAALGRAGGGGRGNATVADNYDGFTALFNGRDLTGWDGDPMFWSVQNGVIVAESTPEKVVSDNTFLIWKGGSLRDFELKVDYRFASGNGNSGVQFRSRMSGAGRGGAERPWGIAGYQMDMVTAGGTGSGVFYTEGGGFGLLPQATAIRVATGANGQTEQRLIGSLGTGVADAIKPGPDWNTYHIIARGNTIMAFVNGRMTAMLVDENKTGAQYAQEGLLALQMHVGQPFRLEFKNIYVKHLTPEALVK